MAKTSPFDHDTLNALSLFLQLQADEDIYLDAGFSEGANEPTYGEMKVREAWEYQLKGQAFQLIHECGKAGGDRYKLVAYRFILHSLDPLKYWNEFNGLLFVDKTKSKWIMIDYHESDKQMRALTIAARNERTRVRAENLFGMLKFVGGIDPKFLLATWIGPGSPLSPYIVSLLQPAMTSAQLMTPAQLTRKPPSVHFITEDSYRPSLTSDDCANITLALVIQLGPIPSDSFGGEERQEMVMKKGCEGCGKMEGIEMKKCGACKGPLYCSKTCQTSLWKGHKTTCKREVSLAEFNDQEEAKEALEAKSSKGHVHDAGCSHGSKQSKRSVGGEE